VTFTYLRILISSYLVKFITLTCVTFTYLRMELLGKIYYINLCDFYSSPHLLTTTIYCINLCDIYLSPHSNIELLGKIYCINLCDIYSSQYAIWFNLLYFGVFAKNLFIAIIFLHSLLTLAVHLGMCNGCPSLF